MTDFEVQKKVFAMVDKERVPLLAFTEFALIEEADPKKEIISIQPNTVIIFKASSESGGRKAQEQFRDYNLWVFLEVPELSREVHLPEKIGGEFGTESVLGEKGLILMRNLDRNAERHLWELISTVRLISAGIFQDEGNHTSAVDLKGGEFHLSHGDWKTLKSDVAYRHAYLSLFPCKDKVDETRLYHWKTSQTLISTKDLFEKIITPQCKVEAYGALPGVRFIYFIDAKGTNFDAIGCLQSAGSNRGSEGSDLSWLIFPNS